MLYKKSYINKLSKFKIEGTTKLSNYWSIVAPSTLKVGKILAELKL